MKNPILLVLLGAAAIGILSAGVASMLVFHHMDSKAAASDSGASLTLPEPGVGELREELQALRESNERLSSRLGALELRALPTQREDLGPSISPADIRDLQLQVRGLLDRAPGSDAQPQALKVQVADALSAVREDEARVQQLRKLEKQASRLESNVTKMADWLGLNSQQVVEMRVLLAQRDDRDNELTRLWKAGGDEVMLGDIKRTNQATHHADLERVLDTSQMQTLLEASSSKE